MQEMIVALIVAYAAWVVVKRYAPKALRMRVRVVAASAARQAGLASWAAKLETAPYASSCSDSCGTCGGCASDVSSKSDLVATTVQHGITVEQLRRTIRR